MIGEKMQSAINKQINAELYSSYLYLSMSAYFSSENLAGFANWMRVQAQEELMHAMKFFDFINERGGKVTVEKIDQPAVKWENPKAVFQNVLDHEIHVTKLINDLVNLAIEEKDHASNIFLQWFITEQIEEEASAEEVLTKLKMIGTDATALYMLDNELAARVFTPPAAGK